MGKNRSKWLIFLHQSTAIFAKPLILLRDQTGGFNTNCTVTPLPAPGREWVIAGSGLPVIHAPPGGDPHADEEATRCGAAPGATTDQPGAPPAAAADRACEQQRQTVSHGERPDAPVEAGCS